MAKKKKIIPGERKYVSNSQYYRQLKKISKTTGVILKNSIQNGSDFEAIPSSSSLQNNENDNYSSSEEEYDDAVIDNDNASDIDLKLELYKWFTLSGTSVRNSRLLLQIMKSIKNPNELSNLPNDPRSLYPIPKLKYAELHLDDCSPGLFYYFGIKNVLSAYKNQFHDESSTKLEISIHYDGIPIFRTSSMQFWPLLAAFKNKPVFMIGLYEGKKKPENVETMCDKLIKEINNYSENGIIIDEKCYEFQIHSFICDAPAKAMALCMKQHTGYNSCPKCLIKGEYYERRVCFPSIENITPRVPLTFLSEDCNNIDDDDEEDDLEIIIPRKISCLQRIKNFNTITNIPIDAMHCLYLGITKRLIETWLSGSIKKRLISSSALISLNNSLRRCRQFCPSEFQRIPRDITDLTHWRAHEYRQFVMYLSVAIMNDYLPHDHLKHLQIFVCLCRFLSSNDVQGNTEIFTVAETLAKLFITKAATLYGKQFCVYNIHILLHLPADAFNLGNVENFTAFKFESFLGVLKGFIGSGKNPLLQAINKYNSLLNLGSFKTSVKSIKYVIKHIDNNFKSEHYFSYKVLLVNGVKLDVKRQGDSFCSLKNGKIVKVNQILKDKKKDTISISVSEFKSIQSFWKKPINSKLVNIYRCSCLSTNITIIDCEQFSCKYYCIPISGDNDEFMCSAILHSELSEQFKIN